MISIGATDKVGEYEVSVGDGLTKTGERQTQISITRFKKQLGEFYGENITCNVSEWLAFFTAVDKLRKALSEHELTSSEAEGVAAPPTSMEIEK